MFGESVFSQTLFRLGVSATNRRHFGLRIGLYTSIWLGLRRRTCQRFPVGGIGWTGRCWGRSGASWIGGSLGVALRLLILSFCGWRSGGCLFGVVLLPWSRCVLFSRVTPLTVFWLEKTRLSLLRGRGWRSRRVWGRRGFRLVRRLCCQGWLLGCFGFLRLFVLPSFVTFSCQNVTKYWQAQVSSQLSFFSSAVSFSSHFSMIWALLRVLLSLLFW